mmetsp:Transcript_5112/g.6737  ORF Transcript_5112/g.6737 Transcript_5112/m.6737 type:complete len:231 (+) Transcript_5112:329-1021(+)
MTYNCEIWAPALSHREFLRLEAFYMKQLKRIMGVRRRTCNAAIHMELGTFPFKYLVQLSLVKFISRMKFNPSKSRHMTIFHEFLSTECKWVQFWRNTAETADVQGLVVGAVEELNQEYTNLHAAVTLSSHYRSWLMEKVQNSSPLRLYRTIKDFHGFETYLDRVTDPKTRKLLAEFRCGNAKLRVHTGRLHGEDYNDRKCRFCMKEDMLEDELHISLECECFHQQRQKLL